MKRTSLQSGIRWLLVSFALVLSGFFVLLILAYSWVVEDNIFNRMLHSEAQYITQEYDRLGQVVAPRFPFMTLHTSWDTLPVSVQRQRQASPDQVEFTLAEGTIHVSPLVLGEVPWVLVANVTEFEVSRDYLPKLLPWFIASMLIISAIAFLLARYLSASIVKPLHYVAHTLKQHPDNQPLRFTKTFPPNEIGYLANVIERDVNRLQLALQRETSFTRDVSHELRTPAAVINMIVTQMRPQHPLQPASLKQLQSSSQQLEHTIDILLALARAESLETGSFSLLEVIEDCIINHPVLAHQDAAVRDINVDPCYRVTANKNLFRLLMNNILDNVAHHASEIKLEITLIHNQLSVANPSRSTPDENLLAPGVKSERSTGIGQGLHLIQRICDQSGWQLSVDNEPDVFVIHILFLPIQTHSGVYS